MTNQIRPVQFNNGSDTCLETDINCRNIAHREVKNMTNNQSKLRIFGMIITVPMILMGSINPVLSISSSRQLERANGQSSLINSLASKMINQNKNNYFDIHFAGINEQLIAGQKFILDSANFSQKSEFNKPEVFLTSGYYSKDCRRRNVCDD